MLMLMLVIALVIVIDLRFCASYLLIWIRSGTI